jgi:hypothetical protein
MDHFFEVLGRGFLRLQVLAKKKVRVGEEFFCDYNGGTQDALWFEVKSSDDPPKGSASPEIHTVF